MMEFINEITIITKQGTYAIHTIIPTKDQKYTATTIFKHRNVLAEVKKWPWERLHNMT